MSSSIDPTSPAPPVNSGAAQAPTQNQPATEAPPPPPVEQAAPPPPEEPPPSNQPPPDPNVGGNVDRVV